MKIQQWIKQIEENYEIKIKFLKENKSDEIDFQKLQYKNKLMNQE